MSSALQRLWRRARAALRRVLHLPAEPDLDAPEQEMAAGHFTHQGRGIDYRLYLPPGDPRRPRPLLLMLHGCQQDPLDFAAGTRMNRHARAHGVLVLYPAQTERANAQRCWNWFKPQHQHRGHGEPALLAALVRDIMTQHAVDPARIYVAGLSAGGAMADVMAQNYPELFAAAGIHAGLVASAAHTALSALAVMKNGPPMPLPVALLPLPRTRVPIIVFQGDADTTVHPRNAERIVFAALAGGDPEDAQQTTGASPGGHRFTQRSYAARAGHADVVYWQVHGSGHAWSGGSAEGSFTDPAGPDASAEMLRFFLAHPRVRSA